MQLMPHWHACIVGPSETGGVTWISCDMFVRTKEEAAEGVATFVERILMEEGIGPPDWDEWEVTHLVQRNCN